MNISKNLGLLLLAVWLLLTGLIELFSLSFANIDLVMALLAAIAGIVILLQSFNVLKSSGRKRSAGMIGLGIWLVLTGLIALLNLTFAGQGIIMGILALAAGLLIAVGR